MCEWARHVCRSVLTSDRLSATAMMLAGIFRREAYLRNYRCCMKEEGRVRSGQASLSKVCRRFCSEGSRADPDWDEKLQRAGTLDQNKEAHLATSENQHSAPPKAPDLSQRLRERLTQRLAPILTLRHHLVAAPSNFTAGAHSLRRSGDYFRGVT